MRRGRNKERTPTPTPPSIERRIAAVDERIAKLPRHGSLYVETAFAAGEARASLDRARRKVAEIERVLAREE